MSFIETMAMQVGKRLLDEYLTSQSKPSIPQTPEEMAKALMKLITSNTISETELKGIASKLTTPGVNIASLLKPAISKLQGILRSAPGGSHVLVNGILDAVTSTKSFSLSRCDGRMQLFPSTTPAPTVDENGEEISGRSIIFFVDELPDLVDGNPETELDAAWLSWNLVANVKARRTRKRENANVIVTRASIDSTQGGILADATVGPPDGSLMELRFDTGEDGTWTKSKFLATCAHEIGHLLGLHHDDGPGALMSAYLNEAIFAPTARDKQRLAAVGWQLR